ncbi:MAG: hypothetical protein ACRC5F_09305 [Cetobacterium sp.]
MNKIIRNKGLTFLETIASLAIIFVVSSFLYIKINKINEKLDLEKNRRIIQMIFFKYIDKSSYENEKYRIELDFIEKNLIIKKNKIEIEKILLPRKLKYEIPYDRKRNPKFILETTNTGNLSKSFTIYVFGYKEQVENRISFYTFKKQRYLTINTYLNISLKNINYNNILEYHYSEEGEERNGWQKEGYN